ncbi:MAG TPA: ATP-binding protein [Terriglobales bacterium]|jgi:hypothetical protein
MKTVWQAEDSLREKKVESDLKDLLKTLVAFANSVAPGDTAQIFIGEKDDGAVQGVSNTDSIQKKVAAEAAKIYPGIYYRTEVYERDGKQCVRVDIKRNGLTPHFGGQAWVRQSSQTIKATESLFQQLIELRSSKQWELAKWVNKFVTIEWQSGGKLVTYQSTMYRLHKEPARIVVVNGHWVSFYVQTTHTGNYFEYSEPIERLLLSWDAENERLKVLVIE